MKRKTHPPLLTPDKNGCWYYQMLFVEELTNTFLVFHGHCDELPFAETLVALLQLITRV